jgi:undecaprenyl-diphosphatase
MPFYIMGILLVIYKYRLHGLLIVIFAALTILLSDQSSNLIKYFVHRLRPCAVDTTVRLLVAHCNDTFSFTSNHAANHFALAVFLSLVFRRVRWLSLVLIIWAGFISLSQVYVGLHYPADITGGAVLGVIAGYCAFAIFRLLNEKLSQKMPRFFIASTPK